MKFFAAIVILLLTQSALAGDFFWDEFLGKYKIESRKCMSADLVCPSIVSLEFSTNSAGDYQIVEVDSAGKLITSILQKETSPTTTQIMIAVGGLATWTKTVRNADGKVIFREHANFEQPLDFSRPVKYQYGYQDVDPNTGGAKVYWREFTISKE